MLKFFVPAAAAARGRGLFALATLSLATAVTAFGQPNGLLFQLPGPNISGSRFFGFVSDANPFTPFVDKSGPQSATQVIAKPDGTKFYFCLLYTSPSPRD